MSSTNHINLRLIVLLSVIGILCIFILPGLPIGRATATAGIGSQSASGSRLDRWRRNALQKLYEEYIAGSQFSEEEAFILRKFGVGSELTELEADVVISRSLYERYVNGKELTREQE